MDSNTRNTLITAHNIALKYGVADNIQYEIVKFNMNDEERKISAEIDSTKARMNEIQIQYQKLKNFKPKKREEIIKKEERLKELENEYGFLGRHYNELNNKLYGGGYDKTNIKAT